MKNREERVDLNNFSKFDFFSFLKLLLFFRFENKNFSFFFSLLFVDFRSRWNERRWLLLCLMQRFGFDHSQTFTHTIIKNTDRLRDLNILPV